MSFIINVFNQLKEIMINLILELLFDVSTVLNYLLCRQVEIQMK